MDKEIALEILEQHVADKNLIKHMIATGAAMRALAPFFDGDAEQWEIAGILHDYDYTETADAFSKHGHVSYEKLAQFDVSQEIRAVIRAHPAHENFMPTNSFEWALHIVDPLTGLIIAATYMHPSKKICAVDVTFIKKRFKEKRFAAGANREQIALCEAKLNMQLDDFLAVVLGGMQCVAVELGL